MKEDEYKKSCIEMNNEEISYKMSIPMFEEGELEIFDNNIHSIVEEYSKMLVKEKDQILTQRIIMKQEQEIERLNKEILGLNNCIIEFHSEFCNKQAEINRLNNIIKEVREYIENVETLATIDKVNIFSISTLKSILDKGE